MTGFYRLSLPGGVTHTLNVAAWVTGYLPKTITLPPLTADIIIAERFGDFLSCAIAPTA